MQRGRRTQGLDERRVGPRGPKCSPGVVPGALPRSHQDWEQDSDQGWHQDWATQLRVNAAARPRRRRATSARREGRHQTDPPLSTTRSGDRSDGLSTFEVSEGGGAGRSWTTWSKMTNWVLTGSAESVVSDSEGVVVQCKGGGGRDEPLTAVAIQLGRWVAKEYTGCIESIYTCHLVSQPQQKTFLPQRSSCRRSGCRGTS